VTEVTDKSAPLCARLYGGHLWCVTSVTREAIADVINVCGIECIVDDRAMAPHTRDWHHEPSTSGGPHYTTTLSRRGDRRRELLQLNVFAGNDKAKSKAK
jgi:hypothetical protein